MKENGITIEAYGPSQPVTKFAGTSLLLLTPSVVIVTDTSQEGGPLDPVLVKIAAAVTSRSGSSTPIVPTQVLLKWVSQIGAVVVTTSGKDWRMKQQLTVTPDLTEEEMREIETEGATVHQRGFMKHMDS